MEVSFTITHKQSGCGGRGTSHMLFFILYFLTLQYCIGFAIYQNESATGIHVFPILNPPPSPYHPSGSSQCTSSKHPVRLIWLLSLSRTHLLIAEENAELLIDIEYEGTGHLPGSWLILLDLFYHGGIFTFYCKEYLY